MKTGLLLSSLLAASEMPSIDIGTLATKLTAMAALIFLVVFREVVTLPKINKQWADKIESLADQQHEDSVKLNETLTRMREDYAAAHKD